MTPCLLPEVVEQVVNGSLPEDQAAAVRRHLGECGRCRLLLDRHTDNAELRPWAVLARQLPADREPGLELLLDRLHDTAPTLAQDDTSAPGPVAPPSWLGPPRQPGDLGTLGPYRVLRELGRGGMGIVFAGQDDALQRPVAVKVLRPELTDGTARQRLLHEARAAARFQHPQVVRVYAVAGTPEGLPYIVMEYLAGQTLAERLHGGPVLDAGKAVAIAVQVADGLAAAHAAGLVHRDIKPGNIMLVKGADGVEAARATILDFGLARSAERPSGLTREGALAGTPAYMSPEQARGQPALDARTDVYSLGVTLYEMLTGEVPFRGKSHLVLEQILGEEARPLRRLNDAVPRDLETVCLKCLQKEPQKRYASAADLADDLRRWQRGEPIRARPVGRVETLWRWCRRNPRVAALSGGVLALLVLLAVGALVAALLIGQARDEAERKRRQAEESAAAARQAEQRAAASAQAAGNDFALALETLDTLMDKVQDRLGAADGSLEVQRDLMETALDGLRRIARSAEKTPGTDERLVTAHERLGDLFFRLGQRDEARDQYDQGRKLAESLLAADPRRAPLELGLTRCQTNLGNLALYAGDRKGALTWYREALGRLERLAREQPADEEVRRDLAVCCNRVGDAYLGDNDTAAARDWFRRGLEQLTGRTWSGPLRVRVLDDVRSTHARLGRVCTARGDHRAALAEYRTALTYAEDYAAAAIDNALRRKEEGWVWLAIADAHLKLREWAPAGDGIGKGLAILEPLDAANPNQVTLPEDLGWGYSLLGALRRAQGRSADARAAYEKALDHQERVLARSCLTWNANKVLNTCRDLADIEERAERYPQAAAWLDRALAVCRRWQGALPELKERQEGLESDRAVYGRAAQNGLDELGPLPAQPSRLDIGLHRLRALRLAHRGRSEDAVAAVEPLRRAAPGDDEVQWAAARVYALAAAARPGEGEEQRERREKAADALDAALRLNPRLGDDADVEPDLASLRDGPAPGRPL